VQPKPTGRSLFPEYLPGNEYAGVIGTGSWFAGELAERVEAVGRAQHWIKNPTSAT